MDRTTSRFVSFAFIVTGLLFLGLTAGFALQLRWATTLWPWPVGRLTYIFVGSIMAASAVPILWIGLSQEFGAARAGALNLGLSAVGLTVFLLWLYLERGEAQLLYTALAGTVFVGLNLAIYLWSRRIRIRDQRPISRLLRLSFAIFALLLVLVAAALLARRPAIFPWPLKPETATLVGFIFLGAAVYFAHAVRFPRWHLARGQLLGFLAYDLILIPPFLAHFSTVAAAHRLSLTIYTLVLFYSAGLALYYLFIGPETRARPGSARVGPG